MYFRPILSWLSMFILFVFHYFLTHKLNPIYLFNQREPVIIWRSYIRSWCSRTRHTAKKEIVLVGYRRYDDGEWFVGDESRWELDGFLLYWILFKNPHGLWLIIGPWGRGGAMGIQKMPWHERAWACRSARPCTVMHSHTQSCMVIPVIAVMTRAHVLHTGQPVIYTRGSYV